MLNGALGESIEAIRAAFADAVPPECIRVFDVAGHVAASDPANAWRARAGSRLRESFIAGLAPDVTYVSSVVEGWVDDAVTSIGAFDDSLPTSATLYDLIPLVRRGDGYLDDPAYGEFYLRKIEELKRARLLLAISESARDEAISTLAVAPGRVVAVGCGIDPRFRAEDPGTDRAVLHRLGTTMPYVLYVGGFDARKNVRRLVEAYASLREGLCDRYRLVIAGHISAEEERALRDVARAQGLPEDRAHFTGSIDDATLAALYRSASLFVFPSLHEGFGLPAAEAMASGAPTIASRKSSLPEVVGFSEALFDPGKVESIAAAMTRALMDDGFRSHLRNHGLQRAGEFTWEACAERALPALEDLHERSRDRPTVHLVDEVARPRLAYVSPLPPERTGIADYSAGLLPALALHYDIVAVVDQGTVDDAWVRENLPVRDLDWLDAHASEFDRILYHVGNSPFHRRMLDLAKRHAGTVVMHDFSSRACCGGWKSTWPMACPCGRRSTNRTDTVRSSTTPSKGTRPARRIRAICRSWIPREE